MTQSCPKCGGLLENPNPRLHLISSKCVKCGHEEHADGGPKYLLSESKPVLFKVYSDRRALTPAGLGRLRKIFPVLANLSLEKLINMISRGDLLYSREMYESLATDFSNRLGTIPVRIKSGPKT